jgi:hypothetical protein
MRILNAKLDSIYLWESDEEKKKAEIAKRVEKRTVTLLRLGIHFDPDADLTESVGIAVTEGQLADLLIAGEKVEVKTSVDLSGDRMMRAVETLEVLTEKLAKFSNGLPEVQGAMYNERVEVHTPGMGLMLFNRVMLLQDACSDALQSEMDNGWRIVAACPQPDQRRPDYILGRYDPAYALESGAGHSALRG